MTVIIAQFGRQLLWAPEVPLAQPILPDAASSPWGGLIIRPIAFLSEEFIGESGSKERRRPSQNGPNDPNSIYAAHQVF